MVFPPDILRQYTDVYFQLQGTLRIKFSIFILYNTVQYYNCTKCAIQKRSLLDKMFPRERTINCIKSFSWVLFCSDNVLFSFWKKNHRHWRYANYFYTFLMCYAPFKCFQVKVVMLVIMQGLKLRLINSERINESLPW